MGCFAVEKGRSATGRRQEGGLTATTRKARILLFYSNCYAALRSISRVCVSLAGECVVNCVLGVYRCPVLLENKREIRLIKIR